MWHIPPRLVMLCTSVFYEDGDDNDDDGGELFCRMVDWLKHVKPYFQQRPLPEIFIIANLQHAATRIWACAELEFKLNWMKFWGSDNHYTMVPHFSRLKPFKVGVFFC